MLILSLSLEKVRLKIYCICWFIVYRFIFLADWPVNIPDVSSTNQTWRTKLHVKDNINSEEQNRLMRRVQVKIYLPKSRTKANRRKISFHNFGRVSIFFLLFVTGCLKMWNFPAEKLGRKNGRLRYTRAIFLHWFCK